MATPPNQNPNSNPNLPADQVNSTNATAPTGATTAQGNLRDLRGSAKQPASGSGSTGGQRPTVGRVVNYTENGVTQAALVVSVQAKAEMKADGAEDDADYVNLTVFNENGDARGVRKVRRGDQSGQWSWPARQ